MDRRQTAVAAPGHRAHLVPALHGPLPPLQQDALLPAGLLHAGSSSSQSLHDFPAILQRLQQFVLSFFKLVVFYTSLFFSGFS